MISLPLPVPADANGAGANRAAASGAVGADADTAGKLDELFRRLQQPDVDAAAVEAEIDALWSKSGSASMDLLLERGRKAMAAQDWQTAIGFLTALTDHAPEFAEGYNARATAYFNAGLYGPALADIRSALALNPRHFGAMTGLAVILDELGHPRDAREVWQDIERLTPGDPAVKQAIELLDRKIDGARL